MTRRAINKLVVQYREKRLPSPELIKILSAHAAQATDPMEKWYWKAHVAQQNSMSNKYLWANKQLLAYEKFIKGVAPTVLEKFYEGATSYPEMGPQESELFETYRRLVYNYLEMGDLAQARRYCKLAEPRYAGKENQAPEGTLTFAVRRGLPGNKINQAR